ncbi:MAG: sigma-70 family RNA polymerase sigma factor [Planctomycetes bacterium]|nr:sigma-70 family RNA polymerase sigma factor [Planctomycetota bacterium]
MSEPGALELGERLVAQGRWLRLLLMHLAGRKLRQSVELEDLAQEVYVRAVAHQHLVPPEEPKDLPLRRLLARLARTTVVDALRAVRAAKRGAGRTPVRLARSDWSHSGLLENLVAGVQPGPATEAAQWDEQAKLLAAFEQLPGDQRRVLGLRQFEGLPAAEAARRMGRSEDAIHALYRRALDGWGMLLRGPAGG